MGGAPLGGSAGGSGGGDPPAAGGSVFLALPVPVGTDAAVAAAIAALGGLDPALAPVDPQGLHLTLHFFGSLTRPGLGRAGDILRRVAAARGPFRLAVQGLGAFPDWDRPRVLWLGCEGAGGPLGELRAALGPALAVGGFLADSRPFRPHVTVARVRRALAREPRARLRAAAADWPDGHSRRVAVTEVRLMQTLPQPHRPARYRTLEAVPLSGGGRAAGP